MIAGTSHERQVADEVLGQIRRVVKWWIGDARAERDRSTHAGDAHAQAARVSIRQAGDWQALADLLEAAVARDRSHLADLGVEFYAQAAARLADRVEPEWRRVAVEEEGTDDPV